MLPRRILTPSRLIWCLLPTLLLPRVAEAQTHLAIDATQVVRTVDDRHFGVNAVLWDPQTGSDQTVALARAAGIGAVRIPGGVANDSYDWSTNKAYWSPGNLSLGTWTWAAGFDKFAQLIAGIHAQAFVAVNYGSGTPEQAAAWVAYANAGSSLQGSAADLALGVDIYGVDWKTAGYWSALRAATPLGTDDGRNFLRLGRSDAFGLKYWEIGNECFGFWETDYHAAQWDPVTYATVASAYLAKMKAVDPTIKIGVVVALGEDYLDSKSPVHIVTNPRTGATHSGWNPVMLATLKTLAVTPDFLTYHRYEQNPGAESDAILLQAARTWSDDAANLRQQLNDYLGRTAAANVELVVTENNSVQNNTSRSQQSTSLVNGLYLADSLGNVLQTEFNALVWFGLRNGPDDNRNTGGAVYGWRNLGDYGILSIPAAFGSTTYYDAYPTYYVMKLLAHFARGGDTVVRATTDNTLLAVFAAKRRDGTLGLLVINKSPAADQTASIALTGFTPAATASVYSYGMPQDDAAKPGGSGLVDLASSNLSVSGATFTASFAPYSASVISLSAGTAPPPAPTPTPAPTPAPSGSGGGAVGCQIASLLGLLLLCRKWWGRQ